MTKAEKKTKQLRHAAKKARNRRKRDYKKEYARRKQKGAAEGKSPSRARGHYSATEAFFEPNRLKPIKPKDFNKAFKVYEQTGSFRKAGEAMQPAMAFLLSW